MHLATIAAAFLSLVPQESPEEKLQGLLKKFSEFAREVDAGKRTLPSLLGSRNEPPGMIPDFRSLVHEHPEVNPVVVGFLKSEDEPLGARALAVAILAHPYQDSAAELMASVLAEPLDHKLVIIAAFGYHKLGTGDLDWEFALRRVGMAVLSPAWQFPPDTFSGPLRPILGAASKVNLNPMLQSLLRRLEKGEEGTMKHRSLSLAWEFSKREHATEEHRRQVRTHMEKACLEGGAAWYTAIEYFADRHRKPEASNLDIIGRSLERVATEKRAYAIGEAVIHFPGCLYEEPFKRYHDELIEYLSRPGHEGAHSELLWALLNEPGADERVEFMLFKSPSVTLRRRASGTVADRCGYVKKTVGWQRWSPQLKRMLQDPDFEIGYLAANAVGHELSRKDSEFTASERSLWWGRASDWVTSKTRSKLDARESSLLVEARHRLASLKP